MMTFVCFGVDTRDQSDATVEVDLYLSDSSREIECLKKFPGIVKLIQKSSIRLCLQVLQ
jgi:hypothetical protein